MVAYVNNKTKSSLDVFSRFPIHYVKARHVRKITLGSFIFDLSSIPLSLARMQEEEKDFLGPKRLNLPRTMNSCDMRKRCQLRYHLLFAKKRKRKDRYWYSSIVEETSYLIRRIRLGMKKLVGCNVGIIIFIVVFH